MTTFVVPVLPVALRDLPVLPVPVRLPLADADSVVQFCGKRFIRFPFFTELN